MAAPRLRSDKIDWLNMKPRMSEDALQIQCMDYMDAQYPFPKCLAFHVPNGGKRNKVEALKLQRMGVKAGICDILIDTPKGQYHGARIELKVKPNRTTAKQNEIIAYYEARGYYVRVAYTYEEFKAYADEYMSLPDPPGTKPFTVTEMIEGVRKKLQTKPLSEIRPKIKW